MTFRRLRETTRKREPGDERAVTPRTWVLMLACLTGIVAPATASDLCGTTIVANLTLDHDLTCPGNGLIVGADGITINLNGHTITGPGSGVGISVPNRTGVVIVGGTVKNFLAGIQLVNSTAIVVKENRFTGNQDAVFLVGTSGSTIKENTAWQNSRVGVMLRPSGIRNSTQNLVAENTLTDNTNGIILVETPTGNVLKENMISGSSNAGINVNGGVSGNLIQENAFIGNAAGIRLNLVARALADRQQLHREHDCDEYLWNHGACRRQHFQGEHLGGQRGGCLFLAGVEPVRKRGQDGFERTQQNFAPRRTSCFAVALALVSALRPVQGRADFSEWSLPVNLGPPINTPGTEVGPHRLQGRLEPLPSAQFRRLRFAARERR